MNTKITVSIYHIICSGYNTCTAQNGAASAARVKPTIACAKSPSYELQCLQALAVVPVHSTYCVLLLLYMSKTCCCIHHFCDSVIFDNKLRDKDAAACWAQVRIPVDRNRTRVLNTEVTRMVE